MDLVLLDGPHAYPFPDLEYYFFYPHVRKGGGLIVHDIHSLTIRHMYEVLRDDDMWHHEGGVETTTFFVRTHAPSIDPLGDGWPFQRFNRRRFPHPDALNHLFGEGWNAKLPLVSSDAGSAQLSTERIEEMQTELQSAKRELDAAKARATNLESTVSALRQSISWRLTAPLRAAKNFFS